MATLTVRVSGLKRRRRRRQLRPGDARLPGAPFTLFIAAAAGVLFLLESSLADLASLMVGATVVNIGCTPVFARKIALVVDSSSSMNTADRRKLLRTQLEKMEGEGMSPASYDVIGMGTAGNRSDNLMSALGKIYSASGDTVPDAIFALSDFQTVNDRDEDRATLAYWVSEAESNTALRALLSRHGARLYLGSVDHLPSQAMPGLTRIARDSGGGEIIFRNSEEDESRCFQGE